MEPLSKSSTINSNLIFTATETGSGAFTEHFLIDNSIVPVRGTQASHLFNQLREKLKAPRSINKEQEVYLKCTAKLDFTSYFKLVEGDPDCSYYETGQYGSLFFNRPEYLKLSDRKGGGAIWYEYIAAFLCELYSAASPDFYWFVSLIDMSPNADRLQ